MSDQPALDDVTITAPEQIEAYAGPHAIPGVRFRPARQALGVSAWGMNIIELDPHTEGYPEHDHASDDHEEVYVILSGSAVLQVHGQERELGQGQLVRVGPAVKRKFITRGEGVILLALGGTPGKPYEASMGG